jgi:glycosyltransferase involved in cell wall biosynthesis
MAILESETINGLHPIGLLPLPKEPLVSILVSNYNYGRYIGDSIQSALDQTYPNIELIVCDDGSTDDSGSLIEQYLQKDPRVRLIRKDNGGQASGFNAAFAASRGEIIALLDSDDRFLPEKVERIVANFQANPEAGFGVHRVIRMSADLRRQGVWPMTDPLPYGWYGSRLLQDGGILPYMPPTSGLSLHRDVAEMIFPLPLEAPLVSCPDQLITRLAPLFTNVTREDGALAEYRLHGGNNYGPDRVTAASFRRDLDYCAALWGAQKRFLESKDPRLAEAFQPLELHPYISYISYVHARLARDPEVRRYYDRFMECFDRYPDARYRFFWRISLYLPLPIFDFAVNLLIRQSWIKQLVSRWRKMF